MDKMLSVVLPACVKQRTDDQENSTGGRRPA